MARFASKTKCFFQIVLTLLELFLLHGVLFLQRFAFGFVRQLFFSLRMGTSLIASRRYRLLLLFTTLYAISTLVYGLALLAGAAQAIMQLFFKMRR